MKKSILYIVDAVGFHGVVMMVTIHIIAGIAIQLAISFRRIRERKSFRIRAVSAAVKPSIPRNPFFDVYIFGGASLIETGTGTQYFALVFTLAQRNTDVNVTLNNV